MLSASSSIITVISTLVGQMTPLCTIDTNVASGDNWKLEMCQTFWLNVDSKVTIGGVVFTVVSYEKNVSITVSGAAQPIGATFNLTAPKFANGSHRKVEAERKSPTDLTLPFVYLPVPEVTESNEINDDVAYTANIRPIFLMQYDRRKDEIELQQSEIIEPCNEMADFFAWLIQDQQENFERPESMTRKEWMNFGDPTTWGNDKLIFDEPLSGVELRLTLEVSYDAPCLCESVDPVICAPVTMTWNDAAIESTNSGGTKDIKTVDAADGVTPVGTKTTDTGAELIVEVSVGGDPVDTEFNTTPTGVSTPGGSTLAINTVDEDDANVGTLGTNTALEKKITIADSNISNSDDTYSVDLAAEDNLEIPDITHTQSDGSPEILPAQTPMICDPAISTNVYYHRPYIQQTISYATYDSGWRAANGGNDYSQAIPSQALIQAVEPDVANGRIDYLKYFNIWGHKFRFFGLTGGYYDEADGNYYDVDGVLSDKATEFPFYSGTKALIVDGLTGFMMISDRIGTTSWTLAMSDSAIRTDGGYSDWQTVSEPEGMLLWRNDITNFMSTSRPPFNYTQTLFWTGGTRLNATTNGMRLQSSQQAPLTSNTKSNTGANRFYFRVELTGSVAQP